MPAFGISPWPALDTQVNQTGRVWPKLRAEGGRSAHPAFMRTTKGVWGSRRQLLALRHQRPAWGSRNRWMLGPPPQAIRISLWAPQTCPMDAVWWYASGHLPLEHWIRMYSSLSVIKLFDMKIKIWITYIIYNIYICRFGKMGIIQW